MKALDYNGADHFVDKIYDLINSGGSADYIVEEGQSGIWTYRKWASGVAECWGTPTASEIASGSLYVDSTYTLPIEFLNNNYAVTFGGVTNTSAQRNVPVPTVYSTTTTSLTVRKWRNINDTSGGASPSMSINIHGLWKTFTPSVSYSEATMATGTFTVTCPRLNNQVITFSYTMLANRVIFANANIVANTSSDSGRLYLYFADPTAHTAPFHPSYVFGAAEMSDAEYVLSSSVTNNNVWLGGLRGNTSSGKNLQINLILIK